jgi:XTP/dITP diphosphohydrolase
LDQIVVATTNSGKIKEIRDLLAGYPVELLTRDDFQSWPHVVEDGETYLDNARLKARALMVQTGLPALADDSGIEVDALDGAPGIRSARFGGPKATDDQNNLRLAYLLREVPPRQRGARYRCAAVLVTPDGQEVFAEGICEGSITLTPRGGHGFGYDPWFLPAGETRTFGEMDPESKHPISHRGKALKLLIDQMRALGLLGG